MFNKNMTNEEKLEAIYEMTIENHEVLKTIRRQQYFSTITRILYWFVVLVFLGGSYYFIKPFVDLFVNNSSSVEEKFAQFNQLKSQFPEAKALQQVIDGFQKPTSTTK